MWPFKKLKPTMPPEHTPRPKKTGIEVIRLHDESIQDFINCGLVIQAICDHLGLDVVADYDADKLILRKKLRS